ncbi:hypothetical protein [Paraburkholderia sp. BCC1885]|uniref:hypothetical protein n=1 Tax=Paraburkholderia sp. BCC1885 TaxID=2562669 RepID=UPI001182D7FD|nr:hypothetical protein [Paraburkholderia sp. BCC1885]
MTPERFRTIVDAYGADVHRWPDAERAAAVAWADLHRAEADALLAESAGLDAWLASQQVEPPEHALVARIVAGSPARRPLPHRARLWWRGAAFAGIGLAGGVAGAFAMSFFILTGAPTQGHESVSYLTSSFDGSNADWSGE